MIILFRSKKNRQFYFRVVAGNNRTVAQSEGYKTRAARKRGYFALFRAVELSPRIRDLEKH